VEPVAIPKLPKHPSKNPGTCFPIFWENVFKLLISISSFSNSARLQIFPYLVHLLLQKMFWFRITYPKELSNVQNTVLG
jgi:hypothetical protein